MARTPRITAGVLGSEAAFAAGQAERKRSESPGAASLASELVKAWFFRRFA